MPDRKRVLTFLRSDWFLSAVITAIFMLTNRYILGWDDQHLEIPLLKKLIDSSLYLNDYYVESLRANFTSYLYPLLSKIITIEQIPAAYLALYVLSRYFMFFWMFKLWAFLSMEKSKWPAFACVVMFFLVGRTEEFLYRTFSHQEFAFAFIFAAIYLFFRERHLQASLILGIAANFHALYAFFPMVYFSLYHAFFRKRGRIKSTLLNGGVFIAGAVPFLLWAVPRAVEKRVQVDPQVFNGWLEMFLVACPYNFFLHTYPLQKAWPTLADGLANSGAYIFLLVVYLFLLYADRDFRRNKKAQAFCLGAWLLLAAAFYVSYINPSRFGLDLNLVRNAQYLQFLLMGFITLYIFKELSLLTPLKNALLGLMLVALGVRNIYGAVFLLIIMGLLFALKREKRALVAATASLILGSILAIIIFPSVSSGLENKITRYAPAAGIAVALGALSFIYRPVQKQAWWKQGFITLPLLWIFGCFCYMHVIFVHNWNKGGGFWELQRNWEGMQHYVRGHTPKNALFLIPHNMEMGGFRTFSERPVMVEYRDCGIVGFDYPAVYEWKKRIDDIRPFTVISQGDVKGAVMTAIQKYNVDYIIFMRYYAPKEDTAVMKKIYHNDVFVLFKIQKPI